MCISSLSSILLTSSSSPLFYIHHVFYDMLDFTLSLSPEIIFFTLTQTEDRWSGLASGFSSKPALPEGEGIRGRKRCGPETERYSDHYLILVSVCVGCCGYSRICSESQGKCGSSVCVVLTWHCVCRPLTHSWRKPRVSYDTTSL